MANTLLPFCGGLIGTSHRLELDNWIIPEYHTLCHDVEVITVPVLVGSADIWAPLLIAVEWTQIGDHNDYASAGSLARSACAAWGRASRCQVVALSAAAAAPGGAVSVEESL